MVNPPFAPAMRLLLLTALMFVSGCTAHSDSIQPRLGGETIYAEPNAKILSPVWSPDGSKIAFATTHFNTGRGNLYLLDLITQKTSVLIANESIEPVSWSSSNEIALAGLGGIWTVRLDGSGPELVITDGYGPTAAWAPSGRVLAFFENSASVPGSRTESLHLVDLASGADSVIFKTNVKEETAANNISLSPDGTKLAFALTPGVYGSGTNIYVMDLKSRTVFQLTKDGNYNRQPAWSPDSRILAYLSSPPKEQTSYMVFKDLSSTCTVETQNIGWVDIAWSPDGRQMAFARDDSLYLANVQDLLGAKESDNRLPCE